MGRILTITANTTIDQTLLIPAFVPGQTIRARQTVYSMGGKPTDVSYILGQLGYPSHAIGFAAGTIGERVRAMLGALGVEHDFIEVGGESRNNVLVYSDQDGSHTTITTDSLQVSPAHVEALTEKIAHSLDAVACVMLGGTLPKNVPPSVYTEWIALLREREIPVLFDADEPNLSAGLKSRPTYIKPNQNELGRLMGRPVETLTEAYDAAKEIQAAYGCTVIATLGADGGLAVLRDRTWMIPPLDVPVRGTGGAGDAVMAGIAQAISLGEADEMGLRRGFAYAAAVIQMYGTAQLDPAEANGLLPMVQLIPYP
jgi:1-phosphofructokinase family hexose kinase